MMKRLLKWNAKRREWNREHERSWAGQGDPTESGLSPFQVRCEAAVVNALSIVGTAVIDRTVEGMQESYIKARIAGTEWTLFIYYNGAEVSSKASTLVRMEEWDAKSPEEFITIFVGKTVAGVTRPSELSVYFTLRPSRVSVGVRLQRSNPHDRGHYSRRLHGVT